MMTTNSSLISRLYLLLILILLSGNVHSQKISYYYKGSWSSWLLTPGKTFYNADGSGFQLKTEGQVVFFSFRINDYIAPTKKEIKEHYRSNKWFEYNGVVEYYVNDRYPTANDISKACHLVYPNFRNDETPNVKRKCNASIRIAPYKKRPECYNIWFDGIGIGFSVIDLKIKYGKK